MIINNNCNETIYSEPDEIAQTFSKSENTEIFARFISPLNVAEFTKGIWEQKPHVISRKNEDFYNTLFKGSDLNTLLEFSRFSPTEIRVVRNGQQPQFTEYTKGNGRLDIGRISQYYLNGHSIVIHSLENLNASVAEFTQSLRQFFSARVLVNAYMTPKGFQALKAHYDNHDVFIVQIEGSKNWRLYHCAVNCPLDGSFQPDFSRDELPEPEEIRLEKGDVMYIPRGWVHDAEATDESSLHLTIGIHPTQWVDFMTKALVALSLTHEPLRRSLPLGFLRNPKVLYNLELGLVQLADVFKEAGAAEHAYSILQSEFIQTENALPGNTLIKTLDEIAKITLFSLVTKRPCAYSRLIATNDSVSIQFNNATVQAPLSYTDALTYISNSTDEFVVSDLPGLSDNNKISLVQRLVQDGLLLYQIQD